MSRAAGLTNAVTFTGFLSQDDLDRRLQQAHVLAMPSRLPAGGGGEGFGIVYMEAAARGLPVVAGAVAGALDAVTPETGILVDPNDPESVADALIYLLLNEDVRERMGEAARQAWPDAGRNRDETETEKENAMKKRSVEHTSFVIDRHYAAPARVFAAWSDPKTKTRWLMRKCSAVPPSHQPG